MNSISLIVTGLFRFSALYCVGCGSLCFLRNRPFYVSSHIDVNSNPLLSFLMSIVSIVTSCFNPGIANVCLLSSLSVLLEFCQY